MNSLSLKSKIYAGFAVLIVLLIASGLVSYFGQARLSDHLEEIYRVEQVHTHVLEIDRDVQELRLRVDRYVSTGHASLPEDVNSIATRIRSRIQDARKVLVGEEEDELFQRIEGHIDKYARQFDAVVKERQIRRDIVQHRLPMQADRVDDALQQLVSQMETAENRRSNEFHVSVARAELSQAEKSVLRYFENPDTKRANAFSKHIERAKERLQQISDAPSLAQCIDDIETFRATGLRAIQATRGYLFFRNVVMAGEQSEISYHSRALRDLAKSRRDRIAAQGLSVKRLVTRLTMVTILAAMLLGALTAGRLVLLIVPPIASLTTTFDQLSEGKSLPEIPGTHRDDEIGKMAAAAQVFSDQNIKTRKLLAESEALGEELRSKADELEQSNQQLDSFAYVASHDLKSPLRGIRQLATWIEEDAYDTLPEESRNHLEHLRARVTKMESLLQDLLDYSRVGRKQSRVEPVDVANLLAEIVEITDNPHNVSVASRGTLPVLRTVRAPLEQVLMNLVGNAIKHSDKREKETGKVEVSCQRNGNCYRFAVSDNGPGIDPSNHERVFQLYQRVGDPNVEGSGMGLAIVRKQIETLGGEIYIESKLGEGATFEFTWPIDVTRPTV